MTDDELLGALGTDTPTPQGDYAATHRRGDDQPPLARTDRNVILADFGRARSTVVLSNKAPDTKTTTIDLGREQRRALGQKLASALGE